MIHKPLSEIKAADFDALVLGSVPESKTLDYKETLPGDKDDDRKEFLADVVAFANSGGGDIVFGFQEVRDEKGKPTGECVAKGLSKELNTDSEKLRLTEMIRTGLKPILHGFQLEFYKGHPNGIFGVLRIPQSWAAPHMVTFKMRAAFYIRTGAGKAPMDIQEIGNAFNLAASAAEKIKDFRSDRLGRILAEETPVPLIKGGPKVVLHLIPLESLTGHKTIDLKPVENDAVVIRPFHVASGMSPRYNFDGFLRHSVEYRKDASSNYIQLYRDGRIEAVSSGMIRADQSGHIPTTSVERQIIANLDQNLKAYTQLAVSPPVVVLLSLLNIKGCYISPRYDGIEQPIEHQHLLLPDVVVDDLAEPAERILRPIFDAFWNACGYEACQSYNKEGKWAPTG